MPFPAFSSFSDLFSPVGDVGQRVNDSTPSDDVDPRIYSDWPLVLWQVALILEESSDVIGDFFITIVFK